MQWIFADYVAYGIIRDARNDFLPRDAIIARAIDVGANIVQAKTVDSRVSRAGIEVRGF